MKLNNIISGILFIYKILGAYSFYLLKPLHSVKPEHSVKPLHSVKPEHSVNEAFVEMNIDDDIWSHGEVYWDFPNDNTISELDPISEIDSIQEAKITPIYNDEDNTIYQKFFKDKIYFRIKKNYIRKTYTALIKTAYKDLAKLDNLIYEMQDILISNQNTESIESDLAVLLIVTGLSILHKKNKKDDIEYLNLIRNSMKKRERLEEFNRLRRQLSIFFIIIISVLIRNVKSVE